MWRQGEIWWVEFPKPAGRRPALVLTRSSAARHMQNVIVAPLTTYIRYVEAEVIISPEEGVPQLCAANVDNLFTIRAALMDQRIGAVAGETMDHVFAALRYVFAMPA